MRNKRIAPLMAWFFASVGIAMILILIGVAIALAADPEADRLPGDVDNNGTVNNTDLYMVTGYVLKEVSLDPDQISAADMNQDGRINSLDITILSNQIERSTPHHETL